jgi:hypothetical protein
MAFVTCYIRRYPRVCGCVVAGLVACVSIVILWYPVSGILRVVVMDHHRRTVLREAEAKHATLSTFVKMYPGTRTRIEYFSGEMGESSIYGVAGVHDRFLVTLTVPVTIDRQAWRISSFGSARILVQEVTSVQVRPDGRVEISYGDRTWQPSLQEWSEVERSGGDLRILGVPVESAEPLAGFDRVLP